MAMEIKSCWTTQVTLLLFWPIMKGAVAFWFLAHEESVIPREDSFGNTYKKTPKKWSSGLHGNDLGDGVELLCAGTTGKGPSNPSDRLQEQTLFSASGGKSWMGVCCCRLATRELKKEFKMEHNYNFHSLFIPRSDRVLGVKMSPISSLFFLALPLITCLIIDPHMSL